MDYDLQYKLKRGNIKAFHELYNSEIRRLWFICYQTTQDSGKAASLLLNGWKQALEEVILSDSVPQSNFRDIFSKNAFLLTRSELESSDEYEALAEPKLAKEYFVFVDAIKRLDYEERCTYLLTTFGGLSCSILSSLNNESVEQCKNRVSDISRRASDSEQIRKLGMQKSVYLST